MIARIWTCGIVLSTVLEGRLGVVVVVQFEIPLATLVLPVCVPIALPLQFVLDCPLVPGRYSV
jgi:hypothetical protein